MNRGLKKALLYILFAAIFFTIPYFLNVPIAGCILISLIGIVIIK